MKGGRKNTTFLSPSPRLATATSDPLQNGLVIAHLGKGLAVEAAGGDIYLCHTRRRLGDAAVGDNVLWMPCEGELGRVEEILPRRTALTRPGYGGKMRVVAANIDRVMLVFAPEPEPDWLLIDQYLAVCEFRGIDGALVFNKADLAIGERTYADACSEFSRIGYPVYRVSAHTRLGLSELRAALNDQRSMLSGQSGVGKSSLTNALLPEKQLATSQLSQKSGLGRHTTTTATLYHLPDGGDLIDSPGVAIFGLAEFTRHDLAQAYREFQKFIGNCQFNDCRHFNDKGCAVRAAVDDGCISESRYRRFLKLAETL